MMTPQKTAELARQIGVTPDKLTSVYNSWASMSSYDRLPQKDQENIDRIVSLKQAMPAMPSGGR